MIYDFPETDQPIRQGDVFVGLPRVEVTLRTLVVVEDDSAVEIPSAKSLAFGCMGLVAITWNARIMPCTVPNNPIIGLIVPISAM